MAVGFLSDFIKYTSDHTYQKTTVESYSANGYPLVLIGMTWNTLNECHSKSDKYKFSNNPFDLDEIGYEQRKRAQLKFLSREMQSKSLDFIVLQEVDIFTGELPKFVEDFLMKLHSNNWGTVHSKPLDDLNMPLLTLYSKSKLEFVSQRAIFPRDSDGKKCALEATFIYENTGETVCIVNMHLDYETDHSDAILSYQQDQIVAGKFTVIGGDVNHQHRYPNMAGNKLIPSCITNPDTEPKRTGKELLERLDGFMASPPSSDATVTIIEGVCGYFKWVEPSKIKTFLRNNPIDIPEGKFVYKILKPNDRLGNATHLSKPGAPFVIPEAAHLVIISHNKN